LVSTSNTATFTLLSSLMFDLINTSAPLAAILLFPIMFDLLSTSALLTTSILLVILYYTFIGTRTTVKGIYILIYFICHLIELFVDASF
jgi:hypothetical protein